MGRLVKGDIVVVPFPFEDLSQTKRRPALVLATPGPGSVVLAQVTSRPGRNDHAVPLDAQDFLDGALRVRSTIRADRLFTLSQAAVAYRVGRVTSQKTEDVAASVKRMLDAG